MANKRKNTKRLVAGKIDSELVEMLDSVAQEKDGGNRTATLERYLKQGLPFCPGVRVTQPE